MNAMILVVFLTRVQRIVVEAKVNFLKIHMMAYAAATTVSKGL
jgi:hypothetical protein